MKETQHIEWKESWRDEYLRWVCGFAKAEGGTLVIGKNDSGEVVGVDNAARLLEDIPNKVRDILGIVVAVNLRTRPGRTGWKSWWTPIPVRSATRANTTCAAAAPSRSSKARRWTGFCCASRAGTGMACRCRMWRGRPGPTRHARRFANWRRRAAAWRGSVARRASRLVEKLHLNEGKYLKRAATLLFHPDPRVHHRRVREDRILPERRRFALPG